jgi:spore coat polysaccharide biosynthesis predicted glycosyltransferase SpsG
MSTLMPPISSTQNRSSCCIYSACLIAVNMKVTSLSSNQLQQCQWIYIKDQKGICSCYYLKDTTTMKPPFNVSLGSSWFEY